MSSPSERIEHVVVLMMENRSFDHMLGFLPRKGHLRGLEGLTGSEYNLADPANLNSQKFFVSRNACDELETQARGVGPPHEFADVNRQLTNTDLDPSATLPATNNGFVRAWVQSLQSCLNSMHIEDPPTSAEMARVMECFAPAQLPVLTTLAREFVLCDHWFCSIPGPTMPNRLFIHAATSCGYAHNAFGDNFSCRTIYNNLADAGLTWSVYHQNCDIVMNFTQLHYGASSDVDNLHFRDYARFKQDIATGQLANYSFINPRFITHWGDLPEDVEVANSQHAPCDVRCGEKLIADVYNALRANESVWKKVLFVILYDEHGGFYDHVPPPTGVPNPDGIDSKTPNPVFDFTRLGLRTPAILISPWLPRMLDSTVYEHSSLLATVKKLFNLPDFLTQRDRHANSFEHLFEGARFRHDTPEQLSPRRVPEVGPNTRMGHLLDPIQKEVMQGVVCHLPPGEEQEAAVKQIAANTLTARQASDLVERALSCFKERVVANGGLHPDASVNLQIFGTRKTQTQEMEPHGRERASTAGPTPPGPQAVGAGDTIPKP
jgi:phospholipase C